MNGRQEPSPKQPGRSSSPLPRAEKETAGAAPAPAAPEGAGPLSYSVILRAAEENRQISKTAAGRDLPRAGRQDKQPPALPAPPGPAPPAGRRFRSTGEALWEPPPPPPSFQMAKDPAARRARAPGGAAAGPLALMPSRSLPSGGAGENQIVLSRAGAPPLRPRQPPQHGPVFNQQEVVRGLSTSQAQATAREAVVAPESFVARVHAHMRGAGRSADGAPGAGQENNENGDLPLGPFRPSL